MYRNGVAAVQKNSDMRFFENNVVIVSHDASRGTLKISGGKINQVLRDIAEECTRFAVVMQGKGTQVTLIKTHDYFLGSELR